jgi:hypothetical protein
MKRCISMLLWVGLAMPSGVASYAQAPDAQEHKPNESIEAAKTSGQQEGIKHESKRIKLLPNPADVAKRAGASDAGGTKAVAAQMSFRELVTGSNGVEHIRDIKHEFYPGTATLFLREVYQDGKLWSRTEYNEVARTDGVAYTQTYYVPDKATGKLRFVFASTRLVDNQQRLVEIRMRFANDSSDRVTSLKYNTEGEPIDALDIHLRHNEGERIEWVVDEAERDLLIERLLDSSKRKGSDVALPVTQPKIQPCSETPGSEDSKSGEADQAFRASLKANQCFKVPENHER